jgi:hypothetical protein
MPAFPTADAAVLERLRQFDTPTICNVLELLNCRPRTAGYMDARVQACFPRLPPMVGYASTATVQRRRRDRATPTRAWPNRSS